MEGDIPPVHSSEQEPGVRLDMPDAIIGVLEVSSNLANVKLARDIGKVIDFARGESSPDSPEAQSISMLEEVEERYTQGKKDADEVPDREVLRLLGEARAKLGRGSIVAAAHFIEDINEIIRQNQGLFYVVYTDGTEAQLRQVEHYVHQQTGKSEFYDNPHGAHDNRQARAYMIDVSQLPAAARREIDDRF